MAITFPRTLPSAANKVVGLSFYLQSMLEVTPTRAGRQIAKNLGPDLWRMRYQLAALNAADAGEARALYDTLTSIEEFYAFDHSRTYPLAYRGTKWAGLTVGGNPFNGLGSLSDVTDSKLIDIVNLPAGFVLSPGDYLAFNFSTSLRALHRVVAAKTANGSGEISDVEVRPHVRPGWTASADVSFYRPTCRAIILPGSYSENHDMLTRRTTISFEAIQTL